MYQVLIRTRWRRLIEPFEEMYLHGLSTRDIANLLNVSKSLVARVIKQSGISREPQEAMQLAAYKQEFPESTHWRTCRLRSRKLYQKYHNVVLKSDEHVHHIDGDYSNNRIENLEVVPARLHSSLHHRGPEYHIPRHKRPKRQEYMKRYLAEYRRKS